jgi:hypothetical protein
VHTFRNSGMQEGLQALICKEEGSSRVAVPAASAPTECKARQLAVDVHRWEGQRIFVQDTPASAIRTFYCVRVEPGALLVREKGREFILTRVPKMTIRNQVEMDNDQVAGKIRNLDRMLRSYTQEGQSEVEALKAHVAELEGKLERQNAYLEEAMRETRRYFIRNEQNASYKGTSL